MQVSMDKVVNKDLEDGQVLKQLIPTTPAHQNSQANSRGLFLVCSLSLLMCITLGSNTANGFCWKPAVLKWHGCYSL